MQKDFHHTVTYVLARLAGFDNHKANIIAYSSHYIDEIAKPGLFTSGPKSYIPFHFLPGGEGLGSYKTLCRPNSAIAKEMIKDCIASKDEDGSCSLHRLGITAHAYADTWAHQDFAGFKIKLNDVKTLKSDEKKTPWRIKYQIKRLALLGGKIFKSLFPVGHEAVLNYPDLPYLKWSYQKENATEFNRDNTEIYLDACTHIYSFFKNYLKGNQGFIEHIIPETDYQMLELLFLILREEDPDIRHARWNMHIEGGAFSFGPESLSYYHDTFITNDSQLFKKAMQIHKKNILEQILPRHGINS